MQRNNTFTQQFFLSFTGRFQTSILKLREHIPRIHNAEEKEIMTTVQSKVVTEHGNLANRGIFQSKSLKNLYTKVAFINFLSLDLSGYM